MTILTEKSFAREGEILQRAENQLLDSSLWKLSSASCAKGSDHGGA